MSMSKSTANHTDIHADIHASSTEKSSKFKNESDTFSSPVKDQPGERGASIAIRENGSTCCAPSASAGVEEAASPPLCPVAVRYVPGAGRGIFATRDIRPHETVYREEPFVMVPNANRKGIATCLQCVAQFHPPTTGRAAQQALEDGLKCARCKEHFCSTACRDADEGRHRQSGECTALWRTLPSKAELSTDDYNTLRGVACMVMRGYTEAAVRPSALLEDAPKRLPKRLEGVELVFPQLAHATPEAMDLSRPVCSFGACVASLTTNRSLFAEDQLETFAEVYAQYCECVDAQDNDDEDEEGGEEEGEEDEDGDADDGSEDEAEDDDDDDSSITSSTRLDTAPIDADRLPALSEYVFLKIACAFQCNGFSIWNEQKKESASGVYGFAAMVNHSCQPNVRKKFVNGKTLTFMAGPKGVPNGAQLEISYVDTDLCFNIRQWRLQKQYYIDQCRCPRCAAGV